MIATIGPLVQEARRQWWRSSLLYVVGSVVGGLALFTGVAYAGRYTVARLHPVMQWMLVGAFAGALSLRELGMLRWRLPMVYRTIPRIWWVRLGSDWGALIWGLLLGFGVATIIPFGTFYVVGLWAALVGKPFYGLVLGLCYGFARALPVLVASGALVAYPKSCKPRVAVSRIADAIVGRAGTIHLVNGSALAGFAGAVLGTILVATW